MFFTAAQHGATNLYGAKVIPGRGAWLEFETAASGALYVKIDRKRKIPVTTLLRALGMNEAQLREAFKHVDQGKLSYVTATLDKDPTRGQNEALIEVYRRLRPGDLATVDNARSLVENMFYNFKRFDFSRVGRYKINAPAGSESPQHHENRVMRLEDLTAIVAELIRLNNTQEPADDIDSLANRRVKLVGELVQRQFRIGLLRMERNTKDRMSMSEIETVTARPAGERPADCGCRARIFCQLAAQSVHGSDQPAQRIGSQAALELHGPWWFEPANAPGLKSVTPTLRTTAAFVLSNARGRQHRPGAKSGQLRPHQ